YAYRICDNNGTWINNWTNYTECLLLIANNESDTDASKYQFIRQLEWLCKSILTLKLYSTLASINWMFIEGFQLHSRVTVSILRKDAPFKLYHILGWGNYYIEIQILPKAMFKSKMFIVVR
ncbi:7 transmembrane receptor-like protein, partial [Euroglyphus maynei]